ncbi:MAG: NifB/NifX family molybdenum-iron cluster-binding protein [Thermoleophilia bacterium]
MDELTNRTLRIAVPSEAPGGLDARRSGHFGRCECFTVVDVGANGVSDVFVVDNGPHVDGGCLTPVNLLAGHKVEALVVDGIGGRPLQGFQDVGITVHAGYGTTVAETVQAYASGMLPVLGLEGACHH